MNFVPADAARQPSAEEWRVICAMTWDAVFVAARGGYERACFHGYCVDAYRAANPGSALNRVSVTLHGDDALRPLDEANIEVARHAGVRSAWSITARRPCPCGSAPI